MGLVGGRMILVRVGFQHHRSRWVADIVWVEGGPAISDDVGVDGGVGAVGVSG